MIRFGIDLEDEIANKLEKQAAENKRKRKAEAEKILEDYFKNK